MKSARTHPIVAQVRAGNPVPRVPDVADQPLAEALLATILTLDRPATRNPAGGGVSRRRRIRRTTALALAGAVVAGGIAYGAVRWTNDDLPASGRDSAAFVLPDSTILPGGYERTRPPLYQDLPERPSIRFPVGITYAQALSDYYYARQAGEALPAGAELTDPLPAGVIAQISEGVVRLDPAAPAGYDLSNGQVSVFDSPPDRTPTVGPLLGRCQILLGDDTPIGSPACPSGPATVRLVYERNGRWLPLGDMPIRPRTATDAAGPTAVSLLSEAPATGNRRVPDDFVAQFTRMTDRTPTSPLAHYQPDFAQARFAMRRGNTSYWLVPGRDGVVCTLAIGAKGNGISCNSLSMLATTGAIVQWGTDGTQRRTWGVAADGYTRISAPDGTTQSITNNFFVINLHGRGESKLTLSGPAGTRSVNVP